MAAADQPGDPNMALARLFATNPGPAPPLSESLGPIERRAELLHRIDGPLVGPLKLADVAGQIATRVRKILRITPEYMPDVPDPIEREAFL